LEGWIEVRLLPFTIGTCYSKEGMKKMARQDWGKFIITAKFYVRRGT
jgi:hypothetical protein